MCEKTKTCLRWVLVALFATIGMLLLQTDRSSAATGINQQISFEGKVVSASGTNIPDGTYNMEFKIYQDGNGCVSSGTSPCGGTLKWTEDHLVSTSTSVTVTAGTFQVNLGSVSAFNTNINWNQDTLWLSMQIGSTSSCTVTTTFQSNCGGDGEMLPFIRLTSVPYALNSGQVGGLTASQLVQLQTGTITNQTGGLGVTGNIQSGGTISATTLTQNSNTVCDSSSNCSNYLTSSTGVQLQSTAGTPQTGYLNISGTAIAGALQVASGGTIDSTSLGVLNIGTGSGTSTVNIGKAAQTVNIASAITNAASTTSQNFKLQLQGTVNSTSVNSQYSIQNQVTFTPAGGALTTLAAMINIPAIGGTNNVTTAIGALSRVDTASGYSGQITNANGIEAGTPTLSGTNPISYYSGVKVDSNTANVGTSGINAANYGVNLYVPAGNSAYTSNYGLYIQGNGAASGTNYSLYDASTALSYFAGGLSVAGTTTLSGLSTAGIVTNTAGGVLGTVAVVPATNGGTGQSSYTIGDLLYASGTTAVGKLSDSATVGLCLQSGGTGVAPSWGTCSSGGATTSLNNLSGVAINTSLLPGADNTIDAGSVSYSFRTGYFDTSLISPTLQSASSTALTITGNAASTWSTNNASLSITAGGGNILALDTGSSGTVDIGASAATTVNVGAVGSTAVGTTINIGGTTGAAQDINIGGTGASGGSNSGTVTSIQGGNVTLWIQNSGATLQTMTNSNTAFQVENAAGVPIFLVDTLDSATNNLLTNGGFELGSGTVANNWSAVGGAVISRNTSAPYHYGGLASESVDTSAASTGITTTAINGSPASGTYTISFYALLQTGSGTTSGTSYKAFINAGTAVTCSGNTLVTTGFQRITCASVNAPATITSITIESTDATAHNTYIDGVQLVSGAAALPAVNGEIQLRGAIANPVDFQALSNSTTAFQIQNSAGNSNLLVADTLNGGISIGGTLATTGTVTGGTYNGATISSTSFNSAPITSTTFNAQTITSTALTFTGAATISDGTNALAIGNTSTTNLNLVGPTYTTSTKGVQIGSSTAAANPTLLLLNQGTVTSGSETSGTCAASVNNGALYYNTSSNAIRACINGGWEDVVTTAGLGIQLYGVVPDSGAVPGDLESTSTSGVSGPCKVSWASATTVTVQACTVYSGGHKITQTQVTVTLPAMAINTFTHLCYWNGTTATGPITNATSWFTTTSTTETASLPTFSANNPVVCLATIKNNASTANTISQIYDTRVFTNSTKQFVEGSAALAPGWLVVNNTTNTTQVTTTTSVTELAGVMAAGSASAWASGGPNGIMITDGNAEVESTAGTTSAYNYIEGGATAGYNTPTTTTPTTYGPAKILGIALTAYGSCATPSAASCQGSVLTDVNPM